MPSYVTGRLTRDGRKRAPMHLFGTRHIKPFPWMRVGLSATVVGALTLSAYRRLYYVSPEEQFIRKVQVKPYGVMGTQMTLQGGLRREAGEPDATVVVTDPAELRRLYGSAQGATGLSGALYKWLNLQGPFPDVVVLAMNKVCDAKYHKYEEDKNVIHVVAPDFREGIWSEREAAIELARAYRNTLHEFVMSECDTLRMVPLSSGAQAGPLYNQLPAITHEALLAAFDQLHIFDKEYVLRPKKNIELCVFMNREWDMFQTAFASLPPTFHRV